jgi:hypothetical protein
MASVAIFFYEQMGLLYNLKKIYAQPAMAKNGKPSF